MNSISEMGIHKSIQHLLRNKSMIFQDMTLLCLLWALNSALNLIPLKSYQRATLGTKKSRPLETNNWPPCFMSSSVSALSLSQSLCFFTGGKFYNLSRYAVTTVGMESVFIHLSTVSNFGNVSLGFACYECLQVSWPGIVA